jgi:hypothetical protein
MVSTGVGRSIGRRGISFSVVGFISSSVVTAKNLVKSQSPAPTLHIIVTLIQVSFGILKVYNTLNHPAF